MSNKKTQIGQRKSLLAGASVLAAAAAALTGTPAMAQEEDEAIVVTGTRIVVPGVESASPIVSVGAEEIQLFQEPEVERILATLPSTLAADGQNRNNGTSGAATINLRGLGSNRNLIMIDGRRLVPFGAGGVVDTQQVPTAFIERIDIVTGGASAVYGSDAISGAINFVLKRDFEGVELDYNRSITGENDGEINTVSLNFGANVADGRGNVAVSLNYAEREGVQLGARPLGQLGIVTADGGGYADFLAGNTPAPPADPLCQAEGAVAAGGSTTTTPTRIAVVGGTTASYAGLNQFRTDGSIGANCSVFNFNPYNYYQTPQERFGATAIGHFEINEYAEAYGRFTFSNTLVRQQVAPSGIFGTPMFVNMDNPLINAGVRAALIAAAAGDPLITDVGPLPNWRDNDNSGTVTAPDDLLLSIRRRTTEFGPRSTTFNADTFQVAGGLRGAIGDSGWSYDTYISHGRVNTTQVNAGYTNIANIADQTLSTDGVTCRDTTNPSCVPLNLFGPVITDALAIQYGSATALQRNTTEQTVFSANVSGEIASFRSPWASSGVGLGIGYEYRHEAASVTPDECLKLQPASCLGGAGGVTLPLSGSYDVHEMFAEAIMPIAQDQSWARSLDLELGYRRSDYSLSGVNETYKYGVNWEPMDGLRIRAMRQRAARAPNVSELFFPQSSGLSNATFDPCSVTNAAAFPDAVLQARCESTGMLAGQVGVVADGVIAGQVPAFFGTDPTSLPEPEIADTTTVGVVWAPNFGDSFINNAVISLDWYNIEIENTIGAFGAQETLDGCYNQGVVSLCNAIQRVAGELGLPGAGVQQFTTNLLSAQAEGIELGARFGVDLGGFGGLTVSFNANKYLTQETQSASFLDPIDCLGYYGNQCGNPLPEMRWIQRTVWDIGNFQLGYLWRHIGEADVEPAQAGATFAQFRTIDAYDYIDLTAGWNMTDAVRLDFQIRNSTNEEPPVVGNEAGTTSTNSGNTFPSVYDTLGRVYGVGLNVRF